MLINQIHRALVCAVAGLMFTLALVVIVCRPGSAQSAKPDLAGMVITEQSLDLRVVPIAFPNPLLHPATLIEFSYIISQSGLKYVADTSGGESLAGVFAEVILYDSTNSPVDSNSQVFYCRAPQGNDQSLKLSNRIRLVIEPGRYSYRFTVMDIASKREEYKADALIITPLRDSALSISGIELANRLEFVKGEANRDNPLVKNGRLVSPNPLGVYPANDSVIHVYAEIYNLHKNSDDKYRMGVRLELAGQKLKFADILDESFWEIDGSSVVYAKSVFHSQTKPGKYMLNLIVSDANAGITDTSSRRVFLYDRSTGLLYSDADDTTAEAQTYQAFSHQDHLNMIYWLLSPGQRDLLEGLNFVGQQQFIEEFWIDNDYDPLTPEKEYRNEILNRYTTALKKYSFTLLSANGWNTDPGRVLLQYGFPDDIIEVPAPSISNDITSYNSWERWTYDRVQGGVYFIFANERGFSEYLLRHSNARGETFDRGIEDEINQLFRQSGG